MGINACLVRKKGKWMVKPDCRQRVCWRQEGTECKIDRIGETVPQEALVQKPEMTEKPVPEYPGFSIKPYKPFFMD